jgi:4-amino-4-deoxy-L-arabinose transferase-like glycosyltransferase
MATFSARRGASQRAYATPAGPWPLVALLAVVAALAIGWVGYTASDDAAYYQAAQLWLVHPPVAGADHWATRFPLILSLAGAFAVFGGGPVAMGVTALGWYVVFLALVRDLAARIAGPRAGWLAVILMATLPVVIAQATTVSCDLAEASFLILAVRLIGDVAVGEAGGWRPFAAGLALGGAILCRETTALALFGFVPLFLIGRPVPRRALVVMGLGCALLIGGEALYQYALTGDPLHRWTLAFHHDNHIDRAANEEGNFLVNPVIDPLLVLLVNDDFALLFWLAIAATVAGVHHRLRPDGARRMAILIAIASAAFLLVGALYTKLVLNPRYFMLPAVAAAITVAAWLDTLRVVPRALLLCTAVGASLLMLSVENAHPRWPAQALTVAAKAHPAVAIHGDPETVHRAELPLRWAAIATVSAAPPTTDALAFSDEAHAPSGFRVVARYPSPPTVLGRILSAIGLAGHLPAKVRNRLIAPNPTMILSRPATLRTSPEPARSPA